MGHVGNPRARSIEDDLTLQVRAHEGEDRPIPLDALLLPGREDVLVELLRQVLRQPGLLDQTLDAIDVLLERGHRGSGAVLPITIKPSTSSNFNFR